MNDLEHKINELYMTTKDYSTVRNRLLMMTVSQEDVCPVEYCINRENNTALIFKIKLSDGRYVKVNKIMVKNYWKVDDETLINDATRKMCGE